MNTTLKTGLSFVQYKVVTPALNFTFPFPYLSQADVKVNINGTDITAFSWVNSSEIALDTLPAVDDIVVISRNTTQNSRLVNFQDGGTLNESTLDLDSNQLFYMSQEALDTASLSVFIDITNATGDANFSRLINLLDGINDGDAVTMRQFNDASADAATALAQSTTALATANGIAATANTALADSAAAVIDADAAIVAAAAAQAAADAAQADADTGIANAATAQSTANTANSDLATHLADTDAHGATGAVVGTTNTQVLTNKTMTSPVLNSPSIVTPSRSDIKQDTKANLDAYATTATNGQLCWATDLKQAYAVKDGLLTSVGGSSGSLDTIFQLLSEESLTDWSTGNNATALGGGVLAGTFTKETASQLAGLSSYKFTQAAGSLNDYLMSPSQAVARRFRGKQVVLFFPMKYDGANNDIEVKFYDVTNAAFITSSVFVQNATSATNGVAMMKAVITIPLTCANIRVGFHVKVLSSGSVLEFDDVQMSSDTTIYATVDTGVIGEVVAYAGALVPSNFLACDGTAVSRTLYSALFAIIGITHGSGDGSTTFNLPDYRGRFLRGVNGGASNDPDAASRTAMNTGGNTGNNVGSIQADELDGHFHVQGLSANSVTGRYGSTTTGSNGSHADNGAGSASPIGVNTSTVGGNETRPKNAYVNYCIRFSTSTPNTIIMANESFSTDTASLVYAGSATYTLSTLANAPIGTFITYSKSTSNTLTQTTAAPTQTTSDMNTNGILSMLGISGTAVAATTPGAFAMQIGKGMKGVDIQVFKTSAKTTAGSSQGYNGGTTASGVVFSYNEKTGVLFWTTCNSNIGTVTTWFQAFEDGTQVSHGTQTYLVINAGKSPALSGVPLNQPKIAVLSQVIADTTAGQSIGTGTWTAIALGNITDVSSIVKSLSASQFVLLPGTYDIAAYTHIRTGAGTTSAQCRLRNITNSSTVAVGQKVRSVNSGSEDDMNTGLWGYLTITEETTFEFQGWSSGAGTIGASVTSSAENKIPSVVRITRIL